MAIAEEFVEAMNSGVALSDAVARYNQWLVFTSIIADSYL